MTDEPRPLDEDIDRVVREMMDVDAPREFRGRVLTRLDDRPRTVRRWFAPAAAAAMALILVAVLLPRHREPAPSLPARAATVRSAEPPAPSLPAQVVPETASAPVRASQPRRRAAAPVVHAAIAEPPEGTVVIDALPAPDPIAVEPIEPAPVMIRALETPPLTTLQPIDIPALPPPSGRN